MPADRDTTPPANDPEATLDEAIAALAAGVRSAYELIESLASRPEAVSFGRIAARGRRALDAAGIVELRETLCRLEHAMNEFGADPAPPRCDEDPAADADMVPWAAGVRVREVERVVRVAESTIVVGARFETRLNADEQDEVTAHLRSRLLTASRRTGRAFSTHTHGFTPTADGPVFWWEVVVEGDARERGDLRAQASDLVAEAMDAADLSPTAFLISPRATGDDSPGRTGA